MSAIKRKVSKRSFHDLFAVHILPVLKNNFCYVIEDLTTRSVGLVDVSEVDPVLGYLNTVVHSPSAPAILTTHKHWDHSDGNLKLAAVFPNMTIYGGSKDNVPGCTKPVNDGDSFSLGALRVDVYHTPCHTSGHVLYHVTHPSDPQNGALFTGDTLFVGGIGAFFEGNAAQMCRAMEVAGALPPATCVYPGHEYTVNFLKFSQSVVPDDEFVAGQLRKYETLVADGEPTVPSTIAEELRHNMFMRVFEKGLQAKLGATDPVRAMQHLYDTCP
jgi:hydroxyacylglutathione hydrolase